MIVSLYNFTILDKRIFIFAIQSIIVTPYSEENKIKEMTCSLYPDCAGTTNPGVTWKPDNTLKGICNPIPLNPDNPLKGIRNLVENGIWIKWPRGLTVPI